MVFSGMIASDPAGTASSTSSSGSVLLSEAAIIKSSSASSNCWISCGTPSPHCRFDIDAQSTLLPLNMI
ncbi:hypothetical protein [Neorhizobium sp. DT-125]|uniref:hypothetical protein n=1 Tax=Neorhizobium sp. DT-125 TaxID=3396163 RepID=UPI003F1B4F25